MTKNTTSSTNLAPNVAGALCYAPFIGWIVAIIMLVVEKNNAIRWHAAQSLLLTVVLWVAGMILGFTIVLAMLSLLLSVAGFVISLILAIKTYQGQMIRLPLLADWADKLVKK